MYNIYIIKLIFVGIYFRISENGGFDFGDFLSQVVGGPLINIYFGDFFRGFFFLVVFFLGIFFWWFFFPNWGFLIWLFFIEEIGLFLTQISLLCFWEKHDFIRCVRNFSRNPSENRPVFWKMWQFWPIFSGRRAAGFHYGYQNANIFPGISGVRGFREFCISGNANFKTTITKYIILYKII